MADAARALADQPAGSPMAVHRHQVRVYFEDTDAGGVVYHAAFLAFGERARTEMMRAFGKSHAEMIAETGTAFTVRRCSIDYLRPAKLDDLLLIETEIVDVGAATLDARHRITRDGEELVLIDVRLACMNASGRATRIPAAIRDALATNARAAINPNRKAPGA